MTVRMRTESGLFKSLNGRELINGTKLAIDITCPVLPDRFVAYPSLPAGP